MKPRIRYICAPDATPSRKPIEDTLAGWTALMVMVGIATVICVIRFVIVWNTGGTW